MPNSLFAYGNDATMKISYFSFIFKPSSANVPNHQVSSSRSSSYVPHWLSHIHAHVIYSPLLPTILNIWFHIIHTIHHKPKTYCLAMIRWPWRCIFRSNQDSRALLTYSKTLQHPSFLL